jgi:F-type H+-transporting ATPase subunit epsilon
VADIEVSVVAADHEVWSGTAYRVIAKTTDGDVGVMAGHQPILSVLVPGVVTIRLTDGSAVLAAVHGGFISVQHSKVSILGEVIEMSDEIDVPRAERARDRARAELASAGARAGEAEERREAEAALRRAEVRLRASAGS